MSSIQVSSRTREFPKETDYGTQYKYITNTPDDMRYGYPYYFKITFELISLGLETIYLDVIDPIFLIYSTNGILIEPLVVPLFEEGEVNIDSKFYSYEWTIVPDESYTSLVEIWFECSFFENFDEFGFEFDLIIDEEFFIDEVSIKNDTTVDKTTRSSLADSNPAEISKTSTTNSISDESPNISPRELMKNLIIIIIILAIFIKFLNWVYNRLDDTYIPNSE